MNLAETVFSIVGTAIIGAVGYVLSRLIDHEKRLVRLETATDAELRHIGAEMSMIRNTLASALANIQQIREQLAGMKAHD